jgi:hypothetical protein
MSLRKLFLFSMVAALCLDRPAFSQANGVEIAGGATAQVIGGQSPVVKVIDTDGKEVASIPIEKNPGKFIYSKSVNTLYVVHKSEHFISAVNLTTNQVDKQIKVGAGEAVDLFLSNDGRRLFCYTVSSHDVFVPEVQGFYLFNFLKPPFNPIITAIDTASNDIVATYDWFESFSVGFPTRRFRYFRSQFIAASDHGYLITKSDAIAGRMGHEILGEKFVIFLGNSSHPVTMIDAIGNVTASMLSKDQNLVFVAIEGEKKTDGSLVIVDLEKGTAITRALSDHPKRLFRLGTNLEPWVLGDQEMQALSETGEPIDRRIPLNKLAKPVEDGTTGASAFLDGYPGETLNLGNDYAAIQIVNKHGGSQHKVALIDLKKLQIDAIIKTMSTGEIAGIRTSRYLSAFAASMATGGTLLFIPNLTMRNEALAARPDGRYLFALDLEGHVITVVDVQTATVVRRIAVNDTVTKLQVSSDGKHLICYGKKVQQINLETNNLEN